MGYQLGSKGLTDILKEINQKGNFLISLLTDRDGLLIASASTDNQDHESRSAAVAMVQKTTIQVCEQLGYSAATEFTLCDADGNRFVCRPFTAKGYDLVLAVLMPGKNQAYKRLVNQALLALQREFDI